MWGSIILFLVQNLGYPHIKKKNCTWFYLCDFGHLGPTNTLFKIYMIYFVASKKVYLDMMIFA